MTYSEFLQKLAKERQGRPGTPVIKRISKEQANVTIPENEQPVQKTSYSQMPSETIEQWRTQWDWKQGYMPADYRGPNGETMPYGARGWDWYGNAWYGDGLSGFWNKIKSTLIAPVVNEEDEGIIHYNQSIGGSIGVPGGLSAQQKENIPKIAEEKQNIDVGETIEGLQEGEAGSAIAYTSRAVTAGVNVVLSVFNEAAIKTKQALSIAKGYLEPYYDEPIDTTERKLRAANFTTATGALSWDDIKSIVSGERKMTKEEVDEAYQAGRIFYTTSFVDETLRAEYIRRYREGENPYLLAQQLENPLAELAGEMIIDPTNLIGAGFTRPMRDSKRVNSAIEMFAKVAPEIEEFIKTADAFDDIRAAENIIDVTKIIANKAKDVKAGMTKLAVERGLISLTTDGARWEMGRISHEVFNNIAASTRDNPDEAMEIIRALSNMASGDTDKIADGLSAIAGASKTIKSINPRILLSEAGMRTGVILNSLIGSEEKADEFLRAFQEARKLDFEEFVKWTAGKFDDAIKEMFPTVMERIKLADEIAAGKIKAPTEYQKIIAKVNPAMKYLAKFDNFLQSGKFGIRAINGFFANVYLGLSPRYAARNAMQNYFQALIDEGPGIFRGASHAVQDIKEWTGGITPEGVRGFSAAAAATAKRFGMTKLSENIEKGAATLIVRHSIEKTMRQMLKPGRALPDITPLVEAGLSEKSANHLCHLIIHNKGNVKKAIGEFIENSKTGSLDLMETMMWVSAGDARKLQDLNLYDGVAQVLREARGAGKSVDEAVADIKKLFDENIRKVADQIVDDPDVISRDLPEFAEIVGATKEIGNKETKIISNLYQANREVFYLGRVCVDDILRGGVAEAESLGNADLLANLEKLGKKYRKIANGQREAEFTAQIQAWSDQIIDWKLSVEAAIKNGVTNYSQWWSELGMTGDPPDKPTDFFYRFWNEYYYPNKNKMFAQLRNEIVGALEDIGKAIGGNTKEIDRVLRYAKSAEKYEQLFDVWRAGRLRTAKFIEEGNIADAIRSIASQYGIASLPKADEAAGITGAYIDDKALTKILKKIEEGMKISPVYTGDMPPTIARAFHEGARDIELLEANLETQIRANYGSVIPIIGNENVVKAISKWGEVAERNVNEARLIASAVANAARDFTLLPYGKKYGFDLVLNYIYPYQFFYSRTYANYLKRLVQEPEIIAAYAKYKNTLAKIHAGAPDWWKYQINSNELLGIDSDNPLYFNLEATLNPLNGLTGVDFEDPYKRINWWTSTIDDLNRFGSSIWTPINWAVAAVLYAKGEKEAAQRWGGRIFPQTTTIKSLLYLGNIKTGIPYNELDPMVQFLSGGLDPYEKRRVARALSWMVEEGLITQTEMVEAANTQSGDIWEQAVERAIKVRAPGEITSFFLGVGFKGRSISDMTIDKFYNEYNKIWAISTDLTPDELRKQLDILRNKYPFMDGILLANKTGLDRDRAYAYNVLARIPPGQKNEIAKAAGISAALIDKFYNDKGNMKIWGQADYKKFMAAIADIGAILSIPDSATQQEWSNASAEYKKLMAEGEKIFGEDIWDKIDLYNELNYSGNYASKKKAKAMLNTDPRLSAALDWKTQQTMENKLLYAYYGGISTVERYYRNVMYEDLRKKYGQNIFELQAAYYSIYDNKERKKFLKQYPQLKEMWGEKSKWENNISGYIFNTGKLMPEGKEAQIQKGITPQTTGQKAVLEALETGNEYQYNWDEYKMIMGESLSNLVLDNLLGGEELSDAAQNQLEYIADQMNISVERLLAMMALSLQK